MLLCILNTYFKYVYLKYSTTLATAYRALLSGFRLKTARTDKGKAASTLDFSTVF